MGYFLNILPVFPLSFSTLMNLSRVYPSSSPKAAGIPSLFLLAVQIQFNSIQFNLYSAFYNKIVSRCFTESETQSQNPQFSTVARKKLPFNRKKPRAGPSLQGGTFILRVGQVKDGKKIRDGTERVKRDGTGRVKRGGERARKETFYSTTNVIWKKISTDPSVPGSWSVVTDSSLA